MSKVIPLRTSGRSPESEAHTPNGGRTAVSSTDLHEAEEFAFVDELARRVNDHARRSQFDRLVLIAPAACIRRFRQHAPEAYEKHIVFRFGDFAHCKVERLEELFKETLAASERRSPPEK
jgi:hypothetical protein